MAKPGLKINIYSRGITQTGTKSFSPSWSYQSGLKVIPAGTKDPSPADDRWVGTFSPGWYYQPGLKGPLVPGVKNAEANAKLRHRSKVYSLVVTTDFALLLLAKNIAVFKCYTHNTLLQLQFII